MDLDRCLHATVKDLGVKPARGPAAHTPAEDHRSLIGSPERQLIGQGLLKPRTARGGPVKGPGIGDLQLPDRERVPVATLAILARQGRGQRALPAIEEQADILSRQAIADRGQRVGVPAGRKPVIQRPERDRLAGGLLLGSLVPIQIDPHRERRVGDGLDERGPPVRITDVEVVVIGKDRLAAIDEVRMPVRAAVSPPAPRARFLLSDPDHHDPVTALALSRFEVRAGDLLLHIAL